MPSHIVDGAAFRVRRALSELSDWGLKQRIQWLRWLDHLIVNHKDQILAAVVADKKVSEHQVLLNEYAVIRMLNSYYIKNAYRILKDENRSSIFSLLWPNKKSVVVKEPFGVVGIISPANYPFSLSLGSMIPAILAGNAVMLKPAPGSEKTCEVIKELLDLSLNLHGASKIVEILPSVECFGHDLVRNQLVDKIHFTGSVSSGWWVHQENSKIRLAPVTLELGGSNAALVLEDADVDLAAKVIAWARFCGMSCNNIKRVFVVAAVYEKFLEAIEKEVRDLREHEFERVSEKEACRYVAFLADYHQHLEKKLEGDCGYDFQPKILRIDDPSPNIRVLKEETFVPLLPVVKVQDVEDAVGWANHSKFGLGVSIFTKNRKLFRSLAKRIDCGGVFHNDAMTEFAQPQIPFGGRKNSGSGYIHGPEGLLEFVQLKVIVEERWKFFRFNLYPWTARKMSWLRKFLR